METRLARRLDLPCVQEGPEFPAIDSTNFPGAQCHSGPHLRDRPSQEDHYPRAREAGVLLPEVHHDIHGPDIGSPAGHASPTPTKAPVSGTDPGYTVVPSLGTPKPHLEQLGPIRRRIDL